MTFTFEKSKFSKSELSSFLHNISGIRIAKTTIVWVVT